jgi:predicted anti-sigma-YlaC factor YlaD
MRVRAIMPADCARACQQLSLRLDSELSEFESVLLEAHLARCADCRSFGQSITGFTDALRAVPAEMPTPVTFPVTRRHRMNVLANSLRAASAAAAVAVVALGGLVALQGSRDRVPGVDLQQARLVMGVHESQLERLDKFGETPTREVPPGLAAAEGETPTAPVRASGAAQRTRVSTSARRNQGRR